MFSRYCKSVICPDVIKKEKEKEFVEFLINFGKKYKQKPVLFATSDSYVIIVSKYRDELSSYFRFNFPDKWIV